MSDRWTDRLSEYLDGELSAPERRELEGHLEGCRECATTLADLRRLVEDARSMEDRPPLSDLWPGIAERIGAAGAPAASPEVVELEERQARRRPARRRFTFSLPQLAAASVALMIVSGGAAWMLSETTSAEGPGEVGARAGAEAPAPSVAGNVLVSGDAFPEYVAAIAELERLIAERREELDPGTVRAIEENLSIINQAIAQAQRALVQDPASVYLNEYLAATMRQKLDFLQNAASIARAAS